MKIVLIVAMTRNGLIGRAGGLPWHEPEDLKHFKRMTTGHAIVMGRKTYDSIGKPLPNRRNIVISRSMPPKSELDIVRSLAQALQLCRDRHEEMAFVIGGAQVFSDALPIADELLVTYVEQKELEGDTFFPAWSPEEWSGEVEASYPGLTIVRFQRRPMA